MNSLKDALDRELAHIQGDPGALTAVRRRAVAPRHRSPRPWLLVAGGLVPIGVAAIVAAVLLSGPDHKTGTTNPPPVGVIQQQSPTPAPSATASSSAAARQFIFPIRVDSHEGTTTTSTDGAVTLRGEIPRVTEELGSYAGGAPDQSEIQAESSAVKSVNTVIQSRITGLAAGAFGAARLTGTVRTQVLDYTDHIASVCVSSETSTAEAAHPDDEVQSLVIDLDSATLLDPGTFFTDEATALKTLSQQAAVLLRKQISPTDFVVSGVAPTQKNFRNLAPTPEGLRIDFAYYQVGPRPVNAPHVVIPWSVVDPLLTPATARLFGR